MRVVIDRDQCILLGLWSRQAVVARRGDRLGRRRDLVLDGNPVGRSACVLVMKGRARPVGHGRARLDAIDIESVAIFYYASDSIGRNGWRLRAAHQDRTAPVS